MSAADVNPYASPSPADEPDPVIKAGVWRDGDLLVVRRKRHDLPDRCVRCNAAANGHRSRVKLIVFRKGVALAVFFIFGPWTYLLIRAIRPAAKIRLGLCREHLRQQRRGFWLMWLSMPAALSAIGVSVEIGLNETGLVTMIGIVGIVGTVCGYLSSRLHLAAVRIKGGFVWIEGVCAEFLIGVPETPQQESTLSGAESSFV